MVAGMVVDAGNSATEFFQDKHVVDFSGPTPGGDDGQLEFETSCQWRRSPVRLPLRRLMILLGDCGRQQAQMEGFRERHQSSNLFPLRCAFPVPKEIRMLVERLDQEEVMTCLPSCCIWQSGQGIHCHESPEAA